MGRKPRRKAINPATYKDQWGRPLTKITELLQQDFALRDVAPFRTDLYGDYAYFKAYYGDSLVFVKWGGHSDCCRNEFEFNDRMYAINQRNFNRPLLCRFDEEYKCLYLEFLEGENLEDLVLEKRLETEDAALIIPQLVKIAAALQKAGCVHRGVKLKNFVYTQDKRLVLIDFQYAIDFLAWDRICVNESPLTSEGLRTGFYWDDMENMLKLLQQIGRRKGCREAYDAAESYFKENMGKMTVSYPGRRVMLFKRALLKIIAFPVPVRHLRKKICRYYLPVKFRY